MDSKEQGGSNVPGAVLTAHAADCDACREQALPLERLRAALDLGAPAVDATLLSRAVLARARPALVRAAQRAFWRRVSLGLLLSLLPLPLVLVYDALLLRLIYQVASAILPESLALLLVCNYAALLALLLSLTYAALPLLVVRRSAPGLVSQE